MARAWDAATGQIYTGPVSVAIPLCKGHRRRKALFRFVISAIILGFGGWAAAIAIFDSQEVGKIEGLLVPPVLALGAGVWVLSGKTGLWFTPKRFVGPFVWLDGSQIDYLFTLAPLNPAMISEWVAGYQNNPLQ